MPTPIRSPSHDRASLRPATVSNVGCGFDVLGFALDEPGDVVVGRAAGRVTGVDIAAIHGDGGRLPRDPAQEHRAAPRCSALLTRLGTTARDLADDSQGAAAGERHRQQRRQRGRRGGRRQRAARPAGAARDAARVRDGRRAGRLRRGAPRQRRAVALRRVRPGAQRAIRPTSSACRCPPGWRAPCCTRTSRSRPARRGRCSATRCRSRDAVRQWAQRRRAGRRRSYTAISRCCRARSWITSPSRSARRWCRASPPIKARPRRRRRARLQPVGLGPVDVRAVPRRSTIAPSRRARRCARAFARDVTGVGADLWVSPVGARGRARGQPRRRSA